MVALICSESDGQRSTTKASSGSTAIVPDSVPPSSETGVFTADSGRVAIPPGLNGSAKLNKYDDENFSAPLTIVC
jgi:hypothetical protein